MKQYLDAVHEILERGTRKPNRTGVDTLSTFNINYEIDLQQGFPLLTTKAINWKNIVVEMLWFLSGSTNIDILKMHDCRFWGAWADPETGEVPSAYGAYWRHFPVHDRPTEDEKNEWIGEPIGGFNDQLAWLIGELQRNPMSRRMVVSAWAPGNAQTSKLPPCHAMFVVNVQNADGIVPHPEGLGGTIRGIEQRLCLHLTQRSCDIALGVPYNIASYALLMHLLSRFGGIPVGTFAHTLVDAHAYTSKADGSMTEFDHVPGLKEQLTREPRRLSRLHIDESIKTLADVTDKLLHASTEDVMKCFVLEGYDPHPAINFKVAV
jgi:thymidylate synthase